MDLGIEPKYEYDAPQFVDFTEGLQHVIDPDADKWFGMFIFFDWLFQMQYGPRSSIFLTSCISYYVKIKK